MKRIAFAMFIVLALVTACQSSESTPTPTEIPPTPTAGVPKAASTVAPTAKPAATPTAQPTATPVPPTATPIPPSEFWVSTTDGLNLRAQSNVTGTLIAIVSFGQHLTAIGSQVGPDSRGVLWQQVRTDAGQTGWVAAVLQGTSLLTTTQPLAAVTATVAATPAPAQITPTPVVTATSDVWVNATSGLNMRAQSNAAASVLAVIPFGQHLTAIGARVGPDDKGSVWQQVRTDAGQTGWVAADFLTNTRPVATAAATAAATGPAPTVSAAATELFNRINALRAQKGLPAYKLNSQLTASAAAHSQDMANTGNISHTGSDGSTSAQRIKAAGYSGAFTSENIYGGQVSVDDAWNYWSTDKDHLPNLIEARFTDIGIGAVTSGSNTYYTADFGGP